MKLICKSVPFLITLLLLSSLSIAQNTIDKKPKDQSKDQFKPFLFTGGWLWLGFGSYTYIDVNLVFGSQLTERINVGISGKYQYLNDKESIAGNFETNVYGGSVFSQIVLIKDFRNIIKVKGHGGIITHLEYEFLNTEYNYIYFNQPDSDQSRYWLNNILVGAGYFKQIGKKSKTFILILWNLNPDNKNPYTYPQLKVGFNIGI